MSPRRALTLAGLLSILLCLTAVPSADAQVSVLTQHNDQARDGLNANETFLTLSIVNTNSFGKLFSLPVDGFVYAQPLYVANVAIPGKGTHNVVYIATEHDSVYAYDADGQVSGPLWQDGLASLGCPGGWTCTSVPASANPNTMDLLPEIGITSTPVIDSATGTLYAIAKTKEVSGGTTNYVYRLHALDITTGNERPGSPVLIQGQVPGTGNPNSGGNLQFSPQYSLQRTGLTLVYNGSIPVIYAGFGSWGDNVNWHGWIFAYSYNGTAFSQVSVFSVTPDGTEGQAGVWMAGSGMAVDANNYLYLSTGNGAFDGSRNFGDSYLKLATPGLTIPMNGYFTPSNQLTLDHTDLDIASAGVTLLPDSAGTLQHPHIMIGCGKNGTVYVLDRDNLGGFNSAGDTQIIQELPNLLGAPWDGSSYIENCYSTAAYWQGHVYFGGVRDNVKMFNFSNGKLSTSPVSQSATQYQYPGATASVSANGSTNGIVWTIENSGHGITGDSTGTQAILHAYDATNLASELYNSSLVPSDNAGMPVKFPVPSVANGKVYVGTQSSVAVYGLFGNVSQAPAPSFNPPGGTYATGQSVMLMDSLSGATIYYTTDGSAPSTSSTVYTAQFALSANTIVRAMAVAPGYRNSVISDASYIIGTPALKIVQQAETSAASGTSTLSQGFPSPSIAGDLIIVGVKWGNSTISVSSISDNQGNTYTSAMGPTNWSSNNKRAQLFYAKNISAGAAPITIAVTLAANSTSTFHLYQFEYANADTTAPLDVTSAAIGTGTSLNSGSPTTNYANETIFGWAFCDTGTLTAGTGFFAETTYNGNLAEDKNVTTTGSYNASATNVNSANWFMQMAAFKAAGGTGTITATAGTPQSTTVSTAFATALQAKVVDASTNPVANATVTFTAPTSGASGTFAGTGTNTATATTNGSGVATAPTFTANAAGGPYTVTATVAGVATPANFSLTNLTAPPAAISATAGTPQSATVSTAFATALQAKVVDASTNPVANATVTFTAPTSGASGTFAGTGTNTATATTNASGVATAPTFTANATAGGPYTVTATVTGVATAANFSLTNLAATAAISLVQQAETSVNSGTMTLSQAFPAASNSGDLIVVCVKWGNSTISVSSISDNKGNTYTSAMPPTNWSSNSKRAQLFYAKNIVGGGTPITITATLTANSTSTFHLYQFEFANADTAAPLDATAAAIGTSTAVNSGSATTNYANEMIFGWAIADTGTLTPGTGFTSLTTYKGNLAEDRNVTATGSYSASATNSNSSNWFIQMATFKSQ